MRKILLVFCCVALSAYSYSQSKEVKEKLEEYKTNGLYEIDSENIVVSKVIEYLPDKKDDIYLKVKSYFARAYKDSQSVIQTDDRASGLVIGRGFYKGVFSWHQFIVPISYNAWHVLRVDIKDGRVRVICNVSEWDIDTGVGKNYNHSTFPILGYAPFTDKRINDKGKQAQAFLNLVDVMHFSINAIEEYLKMGSVGENNDDW
ncbi:MAG: DUF4468 domain-containing protein [Tannerella sp.]|nr:DUF4468 domain-containing protein [Tannerella sp.]